MCAPGPFPFARVGEQPALVSLPRGRYCMGAGGAMRRYWVPTIVVAVLGLVFGALYRYLHDPANEANVANYLRSSLHGAGLTVAGWAVHLYFTSRDSAWVRRWPLAVELTIRSLAMAVIVAALAAALEVIL